MTPAEAKLDGIVGALRRKQLLAVAISALVEMFLVAACVYALLRIGLPNIALSKPRRIVLAFGLLLVFVAALLLEHARQSRSNLFLAKRIDLANQLDDHLVSALSFATPTMAGFERACVDSLIMRLQNIRIQIPDVRLERVWLLVPAFLIAGATGAVDYRRRQRPQDDGGTRIALSPGGPAYKAIESLGKTDAGKADPAYVKKIEEARARLEQIVSSTATKESVLKDLSEVRDMIAQQDAASSNITEAALQLGDPKTQRAEHLLSAFRSGQAGAVAEALRELADTLAGNKPPPLTPEERKEIADLLAAVGQATRAASLMNQLEQVSTNVRDPQNGAQAARDVSSVAAPLVDAMTREAARKQLSNALNNALAVVQRQANVEAAKANKQAGGTPGASTRDGGTAVADKLGKPTPGMPDGEDAVPGTETPGGNPAPGTGAGTAKETEWNGGTAESQMSADDQRITAPWTNAPVRTLVSAGAAGDDSARNALRAYLKADKALLEREVRREEIPAEYAQFIQRYFSNIQQDWESQWKPAK